MSFQWQDRDAAARTLGVDTHTLQTWIDDGRAPSRSYQGKVQVLIELLDETDEAGEAAPSPTADMKSAGQPPTAETPHDSRTKQPVSQDDEDASRQGDEAPHAQRVYTQTATTDLELVSKRELQLAGGMVAAWQRLAETSNQDLARARKVGMLSWSLVAALLLTSGIGLWISTRSVTDAQGRLDATQDKLKNVELIAEKSTQKVDALQAQVLSQSQELAKANSELAATMERANLTKSQADAFAAQHLLTKQLADKQIDTAKALADALQKTIDEQKERLTALDAQLKQAREASDSLTAKLTDSEKQIARQQTTIDQLTTERDAAAKKLSGLTADQSSAAATIDGLKKQVSAMQSELEKLKRAAEKEPTSTAEKTGD